MLKRNRRVLRLQLDGTLEPRLRIQIQTQAAKNQQWRNTKAAVQKRRGKVRDAGDSMVRYEAREDDSELEDGAENEDEVDEKGSSSEIGTLMACRQPQEPLPFIFSAILKRLSCSYSATAAVQWSPLDKKLMGNPKLRKAVGIWWITFVTPKDNGSQHGLSKPEFVLLYQGIARLLCGDEMSSLKQRQHQPEGMAGVDDLLLEDEASAGTERAFDPYDDEYELDNALTEITIAADDMMSPFDFGCDYESDCEENGDDESSKTERQQMKEESDRLVTYVKRQIKLRSRRRAFEEGLTREAEAEWARLTKAQEGEKKKNMTAYQRKKASSGPRKYLGVEALAEGVICLALYLTRSTDGAELAGAGGSSASGGGLGDAGGGQPVGGVTSASGDSVRNAAEEAQERLLGRERGCLDFIDWLFPAIFSAEFRAMPLYAHGRHRRGDGGGSTIGDANDATEQERADSVDCATDGTIAIEEAGEGPAPGAGIVGGDGLTASSSCWPCSSASSAFRASPQCSSVSAAHYCSRRALLVSARLHKLVRLKDVAEIADCFRRRSRTAVAAAAAAVVATMLFQKDLSGPEEDEDVSNKTTVSHLSPEVANGDSRKIGWNVFSQVMRPFLQAALDRKAGNPFTKAVVAAAEQRSEEKAVNAVSPASSAAAGVHAGGIRAASLGVDADLGTRKGKQGVAVVKRRESLVNGLQAGILDNKKNSDPHMYYENDEEQDADELLEDGLQVGMLVLARFGKGRIWKAATIEDVHVDGSCVLLYKEGVGSESTRASGGCGGAFGDREANVPRFRVKREGQLSRRRLLRGERVDVAFKGNGVLYSGCVERAVATPSSKDGVRYDIKYDDGEIEKRVQRGHIFAQEGRFPEAGAAAAVSSKPFDSTKRKVKGGKRVGFDASVADDSSASILAGVADLSGVGGGGSARYICRRLFDILRVNNSSGTQEGTWVDWHDAVMLLYVTADDESIPKADAGVKAKARTKAKAFKSQNALRLALCLATEDTNMGSMSDTHDERLGKVMMSKALLQRVIHQCGAPASTAVDTNYQDHRVTARAKPSVLDVVCAALALMTRPRTFPLALTDPINDGDFGCEPPISCAEFLLLVEEQQLVAWDTQVDSQTRSVQLRQKEQASDHNTQVEMQAQASLPSFLPSATAKSAATNNQSGGRGHAETAANKSTPVGSSSGRAKQPARPASSAPSTASTPRRQRRWQKQLQKQQESQRQRQLTRQQREAEALEATAERGSRREVVIEEEAAALLRAGALAEALVGGRPAVLETWATMRRDAKEASWAARQASSGDAKSVPTHAGVNDDAKGAIPSAVLVEMLSTMWDRSTQAWRWMLPGIDEDEGVHEMRGREGTSLRRATLTAGGSSGDTSTTGMNRAAERGRQNDRKKRQQKRFAAQLKLWRDAERTIRQSRRQLGAYKFRHTQMGGRDGGGDRSMAYGAAGLTNTSYAAGRMTMMEQYGGREKQHQRFKGRNPFESSDRASAGKDGGRGDVDPWRGMVKTLLVGQDDEDDEDDEDAQDEDRSYGVDEGVSSGMQARPPREGTRQKTIAQRMSTIGGRSHRRSSIGSGRAATTDASSAGGGGKQSAVGSKRLSMRQRYNADAGDVVSSSTGGSTSQEAGLTPTAAGAAADKTRRRLSARLSVDMKLSEGQLEALRARVQQQQQQQQQ
jgi:hypothetical protein